MRTNLIAFLLPLWLAGRLRRGRPNGDSASVSAALDSSGQTANESALMLATTSGTEAAAASNEAARDGRRAGQDYWQPADLRDRDAKPTTSSATSSPTAPGRTASCT